jgi:hypothetical protein
MSKRDCPFVSTDQTHGVKFWGGMGCGIGEIDAGWFGRRSAPLLSPSRTRRYPISDSFHIKELRELWHGGLVKGCPPPLTVQKLFCYFGILACVSGHCS